MADEPIHWADAELLCPELQEPLLGLCCNRRSTGYRAVWAGDTYRLLMEFSHTGDCIRAILETKPGELIQCYRLKARGDDCLTPCSPEVYDWGWVLEGVEYD